MISPRRQARFVSGLSENRSDGGWRATAHQPHDQRDDEHHQENKEQNLRDTRRCRRHAAETKKSGNHGNDEKNQSPIKHSPALFVSGRPCNRIPFFTGVFFLEQGGMPPGSRASAVRS